ncbi:equilibrative nucleotide transporter 8-like protein [Tanacetum coccineum]|uniref:Equilibrative nucleotide transporter 8-like protein n=1 Tax=Tanacetum coccineum TaxID=301880 RepID=A0ABQ5AIN4_9ASTR
MDVHQPKKQPETSYEHDHDNVDEEPHDKYNIAYMIHFLLGAGYLVPWNAFITAVDYFQSSRVKLPSVQTRMNIGQGLFILALMVAPVTDWIMQGRESRTGDDVAFVVLVSMVMISGLADGLCGGSLVGATGELPGRYMQAVFAGNATAGYLSENVESARFTDWYPIILITTFNVGDFLGKCLTAIYVPKGSKVAIWSSIGRVLFYPLFLGCIHGPKWMHSEAPVMVLTLMLGVSNGYLTSVLMILAPKLVPIEEAEVVGIAMETFLVVGLVVGSAFATVNEAVMNRTLNRVCRGIKSLLRVTILPINNKGTILVISIVKGYVQNEPVNQTLWLAYTYSMPPILSLPLSMACDDSDGCNDEFIGREEQRQGGLHLGVATYKSCSHGRCVLVKASKKSFAKRVISLPLSMACDDSDVCVTMAIGLEAAK